MTQDRAASPPATTLASTEIPYRPEHDSSATGLTVTLAIVLLAMVALIAIVSWLHRRGKLPLGTGGASAPTTRVLERVWLSRSTQLWIVENQGTRLAIVESPRGVAVTALPERTST